MKSFAWVEIKYQDNQRLLRRMRQRLRVWFSSAKRGKLLVGGAALLASGSAWREAIWLVHLNVTARRFVQSSSKSFWGGPSFLHIMCGPLPLLTSEICIYIYSIRNAGLGGKNFATVSRHICIYSKKSTGADNHHMVPSIGIEISYTGSVVHLWNEAVFQKTNSQKKKRHSILQPHWKWEINSSDYQSKQCRESPSRFSPRSCCAVLKSALTLHAVLESVYSSQLTPEHRPAQPFLPVK